MSSTFDDGNYPTPASSWSCAHCGRQGDTPNGSKLHWHRCINTSDSLAPRAFTIDQLIEVTDGDSPEERRAAMFARLLRDLSG